MTSIFMYHAVGGPDDIVGSDPHYAVSKEQFKEQISKIKNSIPLAFQLRDQNSIDTNSITFDDGHLSNYTVAFPYLRDNNLYSEFYINTAFVGTENYMTWEQLKEMDYAGMSIQSHGHHHYYFSDLSEDEIRVELESSKNLIEEKLGSKVTVFAPPGGRYDERVINIAKQLGYKCIATSEPGNVGKVQSYTYPRYAIISSTSADRVANWCNPYSFDSIKQRARYRLFGLAKRVLGNENYDKLRARILNEGND